MFKPRLLIGLDLYDWKVCVHRYFLVSIYLPTYTRSLVLGMKCGADVVLNPSSCNAVDEVMKLSDGFGCDVYIEASGNPKSVTQGYAPVL